MTDETCEDRSYACCEADDTPADERGEEGWYDRHVEAWRAQSRTENRVASGGTPTPLPWSRWPWNRCKGTYARGGYVARCDLRRRHGDEQHVADHGMDVIRWREAHD